MSDRTVAPTYWISVILLFLAGCSLALHMGKAPPALPILRESWNLSLTRTGLIVSIYTALVALLGLPLGLLVRRIGNVRFAITGIAMAGIGALLGAETQNLNALLVTRALEGLGWIITVVSLPTILTSLCAAQDRPLVLAIWGAFVPVGAGFMLLAAPTLQASGSWTLSWRVAGILSLVAALLAVIITYRHRHALMSIQGSWANKTKPARFSELRRPTVWLVGMCFFIYSFQYMSIVSFLPTMFLESSSLSLATLSYLTAIVILGNTIGNVLAGVYLRRGVNYQRLLRAGFIIMGIVTLIIYLDAIPLSLRFFAAFLFSAISGIVPGTLFALAPRVAETPDGTAPVIGLVLQMSGFAQLIGAVVLPFAVEISGSWLAAGVVASTASAIGILIASRIRLPELTA